MQEKRRKGKRKRDGVGLQDAAFPVINSTPDFNRMRSRGTEMSPRKFYSKEPMRVKTTTDARRNSIAKAATSSSPIVASPPPQWFSGASTKLALKQLPKYIKGISTVFHKYYISII